MALLGGQFASGVPLLPVMHLLSLEQALDLVGNRVVRVIAKVRRDFIGSRQKRRAGPTRDVQHLLVRRLLRHLHRINGPHCQTSQHTLEPLLPQSQSIKKHSLVCTGSPCAARSFNRLNNFRAINELGYVCCNDPRLLTTSAAEYGRLIPSNRGLCHHASTSLICCSYKASSAAPALSAVGNSWYASPGKADDTGGCTVGRDDDDDIRW